LAEDEEGPYWTYRHPTVGDAFASSVAKSPELVELYLRGAKPDTVLREVVCAGVKLAGASVTVPTSLNELLIERISSLSALSLAVFICYRANKLVARMLLDSRPDLRNRIDYISTPISDDVDSDFVLALYRHNLLTEEERLKYVEIVRRAAVDEADDSFIEITEIGAVLTPTEYHDILLEVRDSWLTDVGTFVDRLGRNWDTQYAPDDYFDRFKNAAKNFTNALSAEIDASAVQHVVDTTIRTAIIKLQSSYEEPPATPAPRQQSKSKKDSLEELFRDVSD
jgi:hypothetical protein